MDREPKYDTRPYLRCDSHINIELITNIQPEFLESGVIQISSNIRIIVVVIARFQHFVLFALS